VPLHIFEERYKTMINECLRDEKEFGIVWLSDDGLREVGCACAIERVLERMEDGRMNILTRGTTPFRVVERQSELAFPAGLVEFLEDREEPVDEELAGEARGAYAELVRRATDNEPEAEALSDRRCPRWAPTRWPRRSTSGRTRNRGCWTCGLRTRGCGC
jgi:Lon protease-like protein